MVANFYMKSSSKLLFSPLIWSRISSILCTGYYVVIIWQHGENELSKFLSHFNSIHPRIQLTIEKHVRRLLPLLVVLVMKYKQRLSDKNYQKSMHTDLCLHRESNHHHPRQNQLVSKYLNNQAIQIWKVVSPRRIITPKHQPTDEWLLWSWILEESCIQNENFVDPTVASVAYRNGERFSSIHQRQKLLHRQNTLTQRQKYRPTQSTQQHLQTTKDARDLCALGGVHIISWFCRQVCISTLKCSMKTNRHTQAELLAWPARKTCSYQTHTVI